jgi:nucleoside-diphosphate-sugar epimerase
VGSHLVRRLVNDGWWVEAIRRKGAHFPRSQELLGVIWHEHDGSTEGMVDCIAKSSPDVVYHLATFAIAEHTTNELDLLINSNILFGAQLLEAMQINSITRIVNTGTFWQHYQNEAFNPSCLYAATKQAFESLLEYYTKACGFKAITLKLFDTYGLEDTRPKLLNLLFKAAISGEALDMSAGEQLIDLVYIDDVVEAYIAASHEIFKLEESRHEIYSVSSGSPLSLKQVVKLFEMVTHQNVLVNWGAKPYRTREVMIPWNLGRPLPSWEPKTKLFEGILHIFQKRVGDDV